MSPLMGRIMADLAAENTPADAAPIRRRATTISPAEGAKKWADPAGGPGRKRRTAGHRYAAVLHSRPCDCAPAPAGIVLKKQEREIPLHPDDAKTRFLGERPPQSGCHTTSRWSLSVYSHRRPQGPVVESRKRPKSRISSSAREGQFTSVFTQSLLLSNSRGVCFVRLSRSASF
jgi:hypothetical protein